MLNFLKHLLVQKLAAHAPKTKCAACGHEFLPYAGKEVRDFNDLKSFECPNCRQVIKSNQLGVGDEVFVPTEPIAQPVDSRIECQTLNENEKLYSIPNSGKSGGLLFFAIFWNLISWTVTLVFIGSAFKGENILSGPILFVLLFPTVGIGLAYFALRQKYATHLLYLGREKIRLEREMFGHKKTYDLATSAVKEVSLQVFYTQNYQPVHGIQIGEGAAKIKFGSALTQDEKKWLCGDIRDHLHRLNS